MSGLAHLAADRRRRRAMATATAVVALATGCAPPPALPAESDRLRVVTTTGLLRDLVENVGGERVEVASLVPDGADPHAHEPTLRDARNVVYADVAFSNYAMLEEHSIIRTLDANLRDDALNVSLAEESVKYAAELIPLVEDVGLDTVWLGLRARGEGAAHEATRTSQVHLSFTGLDGPGDAFGYLTGAFGQTDVYLDSSDGFDAATGFRDDSVSLPTDAHTHLSWAFTEPGVYTLDVEARLQVEPTSRPVPLDDGHLVLVVGVDPSRADRPGATVLGSGHADLTVDVDAGALQVRHDAEGGGHHDQTVHALDDVLLEVPARARDEVPAGPDLAFLGRPGTPLYQLPQAVLGRHVHGEIDPHLWHDVRNVMAYVQLVRDTLVAADPSGAREHHAAAGDYLARLEELDAHVRERLGRIPSDRRHLVTTHDAYGYLAHAYDLSVAGFVTPNPATEPSLAERRRLTETIRTLEVPAVFLEPGLAARSSTLTEIAGELDVAVCRLYSDSFDDEITTYVQLMRFNADSLASCLSADQENS